MESAGLALIDCEEENESFGDGFGEGFGDDLWFVEDWDEERTFNLGIGGIEMIRLNLCPGTLRVTIFLCFLSLC